LLKLAVWAVFSKKARNELVKQVKRLNITTRAHPRLFE
jgi:hypothetical protein